MRGLTGFGEVLRHIDGGLNSVVKRTAHAQDLRAGQTAGLGEPAQLVIVAQGGRSKNPGFGPLRTAAQHLGLNRLGNVQRRLDQPQLRADFQPPHRAGLAGPCKVLQALTELNRSFLQTRKVRGQLTHTVQSLRRSFAGLGHLYQSQRPGHPVKRFGDSLGPAQFGARKSLAHAKAQFARRPLSLRCKGLPVHQTTGQLQADSQHIPAKVQQLPGGDVLA